MCARRAQGMTAGSPNVESAIGLPIEEMTKADMTLPFGIRQGERSGKIKTGLSKFVERNHL